MEAVGDYLTVAAAKRAQLEVLDGNGPGHR